MAAEHGASLRAEVRRLRRQQHELIARFDALLGADSEVAARVFPLVRSLNQHRGLDARNGFHSHFHGVAIAKASVCVEERRQLRWVKKEGDIARHAPFQTASSGQCNDMDGAGSSHVDPWYYLEGMLNGDTGMVCGASIAFSGSAGLPWEGVSLHAATLHNRACHDALLMQTKMLFSESSNVVYTETASSFVAPRVRDLLLESNVQRYQIFDEDDCGGDSLAMAPDQNKASNSVITAQTQTDSDLTNSVISGDPEILLQIAVHNAAAALHAALQPRLAELSLLLAGALAPLPPALVVVESTEGDCISGLDVAHSQVGNDASLVLSPGLGLPPVPDVVPATFLDGVAVDECRRLMARLLVSWNRLVTEIKSLANPVDDDLNDIFLSNFTRGLMDFLRLSKLGDSCLMIDFVVVADHVASQVVIGCDGWLAHLASSHCTLADWNLGIFDERLNLLSYFLARFVVAFDEAVFAIDDADG